MSANWPREAYGALISIPFDSVAGCLSVIRAVEETYCAISISRRIDGDGMEADLDDTEHRDLQCVERGRYTRARRELDREESWRFRSEFGWISYERATGEGETDEEGCGIGRESSDEEQEHRVRFPHSAHVVRGKGRKFLESKRFPLLRECERWTQWTRKRLAGSPR